MNVFLMCFDSVSLEQPSCARDSNKLQGKPEGHGYPSTDNSGLLLPGAPCCCCKGTSSPILWEMEMRKRKDLGGRGGEGLWLGGCSAALQPRKERCPGWVEPGRKEAAFPPTLLHFLDAPAMPEGAHREEGSSPFCTYWPFAWTDYCCFSSGVQRSCVPGPEEGVCRYRLQLQTVSTHCMGAKQALISCPL